MLQTKKIPPSKVSLTRKRDRAASLLPEPVRLPKPKLTSTKGVGALLRARKTTREIGPKALSLQTLSNLLWAAWGVNRQKGPFGLPGRTAASASNSQEIDLYVCLEGCTYRYEAKNHAIVAVLARDLRRMARTPGQPFFSRSAPVEIVYVVDLHKLTHTEGFQEPGLKDKEVQKSYYFVDTGMIAANVYLFAAAEGLACWFHNCDKRSFEKALGLAKTQRALFGQTVGYAARRAP